MYFRLKNSTFDTMTTKAEQGGHKAQGWVHAFKELADLSYPSLKPTHCYGNYGDRSA